MIIANILNKVISIEQGVKSTNAVGTPYLSWNLYNTFFANVYTPTKAVRFEDGELLVFTTHFTIRYNNSTKQINNKYRINYNGNYYKILQVMELGNKEGIKLICVAFDDE